MAGWLANQALLLVWCGRVLVAGSATVPLADLTLLQPKAKKRAAPKKAPAAKKGKKPKKKAEEEEEEEEEEVGVLRCDAS